MPTPGEGKPAGGADMVGVWPSAVWIVVGTLFYLEHPQSFTGWKGALYYVVGTAVVALVIGLVSLNLRRAIAGMLAEVFPRRDRFTDLMSLMLRLMLATAEGMLVALLARWTLGGLG
ncbi:hypothetical protein ABAZ39_11380 [Azospirillum argentinense]|uniref:Uncharacterized protein n=1 Tax=Azospirillum argentinense TaxID=2970906 RepID=A0A060DNC1_9PROT|nr:hypothetical protein [Azospirillum argentinense]AIB12583.1 hypothetical protein ABAZ39_11380 [Azospirillum argentinense]EZQ09852.1 hypothetical protein ABAZ39_12810 [Azospirillum argentinense]